jgi:hypothetical protein
MTISEKNIDALILLAVALTVFGICYLGIGTFLLSAVALTAFLLVVGFARWLLFSVALAVYRKLFCGGGPVMKQITDSSWFYFFLMIVGIAMIIVLERVR